MNYYYLAASLPALSMETPPAIRVDEFAALCSDHLAPADLRALSALLYGEPAEHHPVVHAWRQAETQLRNTVAAARARRANLDAAGYAREHEGFDTAVEKTVSDAFAAPTPLDRERILDAFRWSVADELGGYNEFSQAAVLAYGLKLKLAQRWAAFNVKTGSEVLDRMVASQPQQDGTADENRETSPRD